jgi:hypothetical protein
MSDETVCEAHCVLCCDLDPDSIVAYLAFAINFFNTIDPNRKSATREQELTPDNGFWPPGVSQQSLRNSHAGA